MNKTEVTNNSQDKFDVNQLFMLRQMAADKFAYLALKGDESGYSEKLKELLRTINAEISARRP